MDEQEMLHRISVDTNVNIELLKDLYHSEEFKALIKAGKSMDAILFFPKELPAAGSGGGEVHLGGVRGGLEIARTV